MRRKLLRNLRRGTQRRIGHERDTPAGISEQGYCFGAAGNGVGTAPDDTVEIESPGGQLTSQVGKLCSKAWRSPGPFFSLAAANWLDTPSPYSERCTARNTPTGVGD